MFDDDESQTLATLREANHLIINRAFDKRDAKEHLNWYIELCKSEAPGVARFFWVPVYGDKRGPQALRAIRADGIPVEFIENVNRRVAEEVLKDYERMFWKEAWLVARQYNLPQRVIGDMSRDAYAEFVCRDLYNAGFVKALEMASDYDPERGVTLGAFVRARVRQAMHDYMRETVNNVRVPRGKLFSKEISRDAPGMEYLGADRDLGEHTEWEKFVALLDVDWRHQIAELIHAAVARDDMPERWGRILELRFLCEPDRRLTLDRIGKLLGIKNHGSMRSSNAQSKPLERFLILPYAVCESFSRFSGRQIITGGYGVADFMECLSYSRSVLNKLHCGNARLPHRRMWPPLLLTARSR